MSDIDLKNAELGGKAKFFTGEHESYKWTKLIDTKLSALDRVKLYSEGLEKMSRNPNLPEMFRNIFKGAFLPFRNAEVLKLFLNQINEFEYSHSEELGNAFEYLLSVMGSQGDAGQFRTPRHIIDFIVACIEPQKNDRILDPACGTAGFLISAYNYILSHNTDKSGKPGSGLSFKERRALSNNFTGYDISHDMVRLSSVNLFLHEFPDPKIYEYDTLGSLDRWDDDFDVIFANPPFMTPTGGVRPHRRFSIQANRSEVLFVDYIAEHINSVTGRAGIIVPEGIIFQSAGAYKTLRKMLVDNNYLFAVVSLPAGVFNPYAGVKTSILLIDKIVAKTTKNILFMKIENDGYDLGAQRRVIDKNDLPEALKILYQFKKASENKTPFKSDTRNIIAVEKEKIAANADYNLSIDRYRANVNVQQSNFEMVSLGEVCEVNPKKSEIKDLAENTLVSFLPMADINENRMDFIPKEERQLSEVFGGYTYFKNDDVLVAKVTPCFENGKSGVAKNLKNEIGFGSSEFYVLRCSENVLPVLIYLIVTSDKFRLEGKEQMTGTGGLQRVPKDFVSNFQFPLPPLFIQQQIVSKIELYQKIIDGGKQVIENYKPQIDIDPKWKMVELGVLCDIVRGSSPRPKSDPKYYGGKIPRLLIADITRDGMYVHPKIDCLTEEGAKLSRPMKAGEVVIAVSANIGLASILRVDACIHDGFVGFRKLSNKILPEFLYWCLMNQKDYSGTQSIGAIFRNLTTSQVSEFLIPLPSIQKQHQLVKQLEQEQQLVNANKDLIKIYEQKIKNKIKEVWGRLKKYKT